jgi:hypothetical protein
MPWILLLQLRQDEALLRHQGYFAHDRPLLHLLMPHLVGRRVELGLPLCQQLDRLHNFLEAFGQLHLRVHLGMCRRLYRRIHISFGTYIQYKQYYDLDESLRGIILLALALAPALAVCSAPALGPALAVSSVLQRVVALALALA